MTGIYAIKNVRSGKLYIGSSRDIGRRWFEHKFDLMRGQHSNPILQRAWRKDGPGAFAFFVIELCQPMSLLSREQYYINLYWSTGLLYNVNRNTRRRGRSYGWT